MTPAHDPGVTPSDLETDPKLGRLLSLRAQLHAERVDASPAVTRALEMADIYVFLALGYLGYTARLFPEES
ncbi:MAG TPA: hypothetical protein VFA94_10620 [Acidimicrobiales bacterium]|nr:hypothetical protein [Acidimicrobiales bacterium]